MIWRHVRFLKRKNTGEKAFNAPEMVTGLQGLEKSTLATSKFEHQQDQLLTDPMICSFGVSGTVLWA